ncbi:tRNA (guanine-N(7)-)-methyltransferase [Salinisphaera sp. PC39]|uniref:tRNA (guanosine(46)-N7)-methyltransferase TrmB n=1 Tax=Salinisphaera sp. PC39 TaxID=1304156 RepID=UPI0033404573
MSTASTHNRRIRSFVRREGRLTPGQQRNLDTLWPHYGLEIGDGPFDWDAVFGRSAPRNLEIGFGAGEVLAELAERHPDEDFLGIEVYRSGVGRLLGELRDRDLDNVRVFCADAVEVLARAVPAASLDTVLLYFPDPWPKKRHHKRRLVQPAFADAVARVLKPGGLWRLATDWANYAEWMREVLDPHPAFENVGDTDGFVSDPPRPGTRFESRGLRKGHAVRDLAYRRV